MTDGKSHNGAALGFGLDKLDEGRWGRVQRIEIGGAALRRLVELGFGLGAQIECVGTSPLGNPRAYYARGAVVAIRNEDAARIIVAPLY